MVLKSTLFQLLLVISALAKPDGQMRPVVPENRIPPSPFLSVGEALKTFKLAPGFVIEPVAAEPLVEKPVCLDFDASGRMWVCEMLGYMPDIAGKGEKNPQGRIVILEDSDHDGKSDKRTVFLDKLLLPRAVSVFEDGVLFMDERHLCWVKRKGDSPDGEPRVIHGKLMDVGNVEHKPNGLLAGLDNRYYLAKSDQRLCRAGDDWVLEPTAFRGQWGIARDDYGRLYHNNNSTLLFADLLAPNLLQGNPGVRMKTRDFTQLGSNRVWPARVTPAVNRAYMSKAHGFDTDVLDPKTFKLVNATSAAGMTIYRGRSFPTDWLGTAFVTEPVCNLVKAIRIEEKDGMLTGSHPLGESEFLASTDERFRPVNAFNAPDGSLYILDMYHGIIQHETYMTPYLRQQTLDRGLEVPALEGGRIYRIRSARRPLEIVPDLAASAAPDLVAMLASRNPWQRETAQRLLVGRKDPATMAPLEELAEKGSVVGRIDAIWTLEGMGALQARHLVSAIRDSQAKLQSSALWASTRLSPAELAKLAPDIIAANPAAPEVLPYLARALGPVGSAAAFDRLASLIEKDNKALFVREAAVSGLDHHEAEFSAAHLADFKDSQLEKWLSEGGNDAQEKAPADTVLTGETKASFLRGKTMFHGEAACFGCHSADGAGMPNLGPPLDESEWVRGKPETLINILLHGLSGPIQVDGQEFHPDAEMPGLGQNPTVSDQTIADIATYIRNEWSNRAAPISVTTVTRQRAATRERAGRTMTAGELER